MSSVVVRIIRETEEGNIVNRNGLTCTLRQFPFDIDTYTLTPLLNENGCYHTSISASDLYKLYVDGQEEISFGGLSGTQLNCENVNGWYYDRINSVRLALSSDNVVIGSNIADSHKLAILGDTSITGNLFLTGNLNAPALSSLTAGITLTQYTLTSNFVSTTGNLLTQINSLSSSVGNINRFTLTSLFNSVTANLQTQINSVSSNQSTVSSNLNSLSSAVGNTNRFVLTSNVDSITSSLTGGTLLSKTSSQIYLTNSSDSLRLGNSTGVTAMKLEIQGQALLGNTTYFGASAEKGRISWGGVPQSFNFYALSTLNASIGTNAGEMITVVSGGNVGINTTTPTQQLSINGNVTVTGNITANNSALSGSLVVGNNLGNRLYLSNVIQNGGIVSSNNGGLISSSGNFITYINTISEAGTGICGLLDAFNYDNPSVRPILRVGHDAKQIDFGVGSNSVPKMRIDGVGNVTIGTGTITGSYKFEVLGNISNTGNLFSSSASNIGLFVLSTGKVGINQSAPAQAFEVSGSLIGGMSFSLGKGGNMTLGYAFNRDFATGNIYDSTRYAFQFTRPNNADRLDTEVYNGSGTLITSRAFTIDSLGFIGMGTNSPSTRLHVVGHESLSGGLIRTQLPDNSVTSNLTSGQSVEYLKGSFKIIAYNDAGTIKYRYLVLSGTDASWTYSTTAP